MEFKDGSVNPIGVKTETWAGLWIVASTLNEYGYDFVITSLNDGKHLPHSRHYIGYAGDVRSRHIKEADIGAIMAAIKKALPRYDVILEKRGLSGEHIHMEFDPRRWHT